MITAINDEVLYHKKEV